jgi:hypothetical protein
VKITRRVIALAVMFLGISAPLLAQPPHEKNLAGTWDLRIKIEHMPGTISALSICGQDGHLMQVQAAGNHLVYGIGTWVQTSHSEFQLRFVTETNDKAGVPTGSQQVLGTAILSGLGDVVAGTAAVQFLDRKGKVVYSGTAKVEGNRVHGTTGLTAMR